MELTLTPRWWKKFCTWLTKAFINFTICFITLPIDWYYDWLLPYLRQFLLIQNRVNEFMDLRAYCPTPPLIISTGNWSVPGDCVFLAFQLPSQSQSHSVQALVVLLYLCLPNINNPMYIERLREGVPPPSQNTVGSVNKSSFASSTMLVLGW